MNRRTAIAIFAALSFAAPVCAGQAVAETRLTNVSYDPTRELYKDFNAAFEKSWKAETAGGRPGAGEPRRLRQARRAR